MTLDQLTKALPRILGVDPKLHTCDITIKGVPHIMVTSQGVGTGVGRTEGEAIRALVEYLLVDIKDKIDSQQGELDYLQRQTEVIQISLGKSRQSVEFLTTILDVDR